MKQLNLGVLLPRAALCLFAFLTCTGAFAQTKSSKGKIAEHVAQLKQSGAFAKETTLFKLVPGAVADAAVAAAVKKYSIVNAEGVEAIQQAKPTYLNCTIPVGNGRALKVLLYKESISPNGFTLLNEKGVVATIQDIVNYRGSIDNDASSVAAFTFANNEVSGFVSNSEGNFVIGKLGKENAKHIIYNDVDLTQQAPFDCSANTAVPQSSTTLARTSEAAAITTKCVNWYWETDYDLFVNKGSLANVNAYMQSVFNQMATLYANDGITVLLRTLFVWTTEDPYTGTSTSGYLDQFGAYRTSFDGDLAHLIGLKGGGGIAWINGACKANRYRMAYSGISASYATVPTYSWTVECITHEQGHLLGSQHTHDCVWNGNNTKIDGCGDNAGYSSGSCANPGNPAGGGTIMSYCHLLQGVGINFTLGFGPQPTERMTNTINAASCLLACSTCVTPSQPAAITGSSTVCATTSQTYSVASVSGATSYTWALPSGWTGTSTTNSITITAGTASGTISVIANNSCGSGTARTLAVTAATTPAPPATVTGNTAVCAGTSQTYSVAAIAGATSYTWTIPSGWTGTSTTNSITLITGSAAGQLTVRANNTCGQGAVKTVALTITSAAPAQPGTISGNTAICAGSSQTYSVAAVSGAASYTWVLPSGWTGSSTTNTITATAGAAGNISVTAVNGCASSAARTLAVTTSPLPAAPGAITVSGGTATVCTGNTRTYTTPLVTGLTYSWTAPTGASITSGQGTNSIQVSFTSSFVSGSSLSVRAVNGCGNSSPTSVTISKQSLATPGAISGPDHSCPNINRGFSIATVSGATSYLWTIPPGASFTSSSTVNSIRVTVGTTSGNVTVKAVSACGTSAASTKYVTIGCVSGIEMDAIKEPASVYPNPATDMVTVRFSASMNEACTLSLADFTGRVLSKKSLTAVTGSNLHSFSVAEYLPGTYFIIIQGKTLKEVLKITIK